MEIGDEVKLDNIRFLIQSPGAPMADKSKQQTPKASQVKATTSETSSSDSSAGKWIITFVVLAAAAVAGAWYMGLLDKFIK